MRLSFNRRRFLKTLVTGAAGVSLAPLLARAAKPGAFSFVLLGDLHFDRMEHHDLDWLQKDKPDDMRQVRDYSRITAEIMPRLFATIRDTLTELKSTQAPPAFVLQVGDLVEGLCGNESLALRHNTEAVEFVRAAGFGVPFLFTKGNHDITGPAAIEAFKTVFHPFLTEETSRFPATGTLTSARYTVEHGDSQFCFFDAYDPQSLPWLEATLAKRTARHCFVIAHPPVVPYGARSTWHVFAHDREKAQRERLLELLGRNNALVLGGHIHKYNVLVRGTAGGGRFLQLALSSVISDSEIVPRNLLSGLADYNSDQVKVEPHFSPATEKQRRAVYQTEAPFVKQFQYADQPGYAVVVVNGAQITANIYSGITRQVWRTLDLSELLAG